VSGTTDTSAVAYDSAMPNEADTCRLCRKTPLRRLFATIRCGKTGTSGQMHL